jgi:aryl-alcohol dehydrogenase-like predicted oxidoreductase/predicted kinase
MAAMAVMAAMAFAGAPGRSRLTLGPRLALGCMRLSTDADRDEERAASTLRAALDAGVRVFDTARAYAWDDTELGHNERLLGRAIRAHGASDVRIVTKGGMRRPAGRWEPDGRARTLQSDCEASLEALDGLPIDLYLVHAPDHRVTWSTTVRALGALLEAGHVRRVGLSNVTRRQLDEALAIAPIAAVQIAWSPFAEEALRGGVVARCIERGLEVLAHSPLGGPERAGRLGEHAELASIAARHGVTPQRVALEALADVHPLVVPVVGARRPSSVAACIAPLALDDADRSALEARLGWRAVLFPPAPAPEGNGELVLLMGVQGSGKTTAAATWVERGYARMNRDERGGTMKTLHEAIDARLAAGDRRLVADNTYTTRASRNAAITVARRHGVAAVGVWLETPVAEAQRNVVLRMLETHGRLLEPEEMRRSRDPSSLGPGALWRLLREVEPPSEDEGFTRLEVVPFVRRAREGRTRAATFMAIDAAKAMGATGATPPTQPEQPMPLATGADELLLVFGWKPGATAEWVRETEARLGVPLACCVHPAGAAVCWCRPPLPGLVLLLAETHGVDLAKSALVGTSDAHARMAKALGMTYRQAAVTGR